MIDMVSDPFISFSVHAYENGTLLGLNFCCGWVQNYCASFSSEHNTNFISPYCATRGLPFFGPHPIVFSSSTTLFFILFSTE